MKMELPHTAVVAAGWSFGSQLNVLGSVKTVIDMVKYTITWTLAVGSDVIHIHAYAKEGRRMHSPIIYRHWQPGDDNAVLALLPSTNEDWFRHKFDDEDLEPEGTGSDLLFLDFSLISC